jgi:hypothetical protein
MKRIYSVFLRLYPREYRELFGPEVLDVFSQAASEHKARGWRSWMWFLATELSGAVIAAAGHWMDRLTREQTPNPFESDLQKMTRAIARRDFAAARAFYFADIKARDDC